jgi:AMMECR1 domain-containing protein
MPHHDELKLLAVYALFGIRTINDANLVNAAQRQLSMSSKSRFGVFVTLHRNENEFLLDDPDAHQIHGCLGHWTPKYQTMSPEELVSHIHQLVQDVRTKDDRRRNFATDVDQDASATLEISFMNLPLREIDDVNQSQFSNQTQGLLVDSGRGKRATYLPGVYPNASWNYIAQSLRQKAGLGRTSAARFYSYDTTVVSFQVHNTLFSALSASYLRTDVAFFYLRHYDKFVPYEYNAATKVASVDVGESVRNAACIGDVIEFAHDYKAAFEGKPILLNLEHYYQKWLKNPVAYRQASIFLIRAYHRLGVHRSRILTMSSKLYDAMARNTLEPRFELGEAVSVLAQVSVPRMKALKHALDFMLERANDMLNAATTPLDTVFELNWQSQSVLQLFKLVSVSRSSMASSELNVYADHAVLLYRVFAQMAQRTILRLDSLETNYLAVIYELLSNLEAVMMLSENSQRDNRNPNARVHDEIRNQRLRYFAALVELRRGEHGLYYFKDGVRARLDITGHVLDSP